MPLGHTCKRISSVGAVSLFGSLASKAAAGSRDGGRWQTRLDSLPGDEQTIRRRSRYRNHRPRFRNGRSSSGECRTARKTVHGACDASDCRSRATADDRIRTDSAGRRFDVHLIHRAVRCGDWPAAIPRPSHRGRCLRDGRRGSWRLPSVARRSSHSSCRASGSCREAFGGVSASIRGSCRAAS